MERLTEKDWDCVSGNILDAVRRLQEIENILGDDYDLDRLRNLVNQRMTLREDVAERMKLVGDLPLDRLRELVEANQAALKGEQKQ